MRAAASGIIELLGGLMKRTCATAPVQRKTYNSKNHFILPFKRVCGQRGFKSKGFLVKEERSWQQTWLDEKTKCRRIINRET